MKKSTSCCPLTSKTTHIFELSWAVLARKQYLICADLSPDSYQMTFTLEEALLWIIDSYVGQKQQLEDKNILMLDLFLRNTQLFS